MAAYPSFEKKKTLLKVSENSEIAHLQIILATNCLVLTHCLNIIYVTGHQQANNSFSFSVLHQY